MWHRTSTHQAITLQIHSSLILVYLPCTLRAETALGSGEFGEVFKGTWETPYGPQEVAIKMLKEGSTDKSKTTFLQEAAIMAQFRHPHIVRLLGAVTVDEPVSDNSACVGAECSLCLYHGHVSCVECMNGN